MHLLRSPANAAHLQRSLEQAGVGRPSPMGCSIQIWPMPKIERLAWTAAAWEDYVHWQSQDRRQLRRVYLLIQACLRDPFAGIGKPEPLRENLAGCWSRRIDEEHRLVYRLDDGLLVILACRVHDR